LWLAALVAAQYVVTHSQLSHNPINFDFLFDPLSKRRRFNKAVFQPALSLGMREKLCSQPYGRSKMAGRKILAVIWEYKAEIYRKNKTAILGNEFGSKNWRQRGRLIPAE